MSMLSYYLAGILVVLAALGYIEVDDDIFITEKVVALPASRAKVFQYLSNMKNYAKWFPWVNTFDPVDDLPMGVGKHFSEVQTLPVLGEVTYDNVITGYESPRLISFISDTWLRPRVDIVLERRKSTSIPTELTWKMYSRRRSYLIKYIVGPLMGFVYTSRARQAMFNLLFEFQKS